MTEGMNERESEPRWYRLTQEEWEHIQKRREESAGKEWYNFAIEDAARLAATYGPSDYEAPVARAIRALKR